MWLNSLHLPERNKWNGVDYLEVFPDLALGGNLAQLYIKSNIGLCFSFRDLTSSLISMPLRSVSWSWDDTFSE